MHKEITNHMIDYTQIQEELLYKRRNEIDEFNVLDKTCLNGVLYSRILEIKDIILHEKAANYVLSCFNKAYYLTTMILLDDHPELHIELYLKRASQGCDYMNNKFQAIVMGMTCTYLASIDEKKWNPQNNSFINMIQTVFNQWNTENKTYDLFIISTWSFPRMTEADFTPRDLSEALQDHNIFFWLDSEYTMNSIKHALKALCHNSEEKITLLNEAIQQAKSWNSVGNLDPYLTELDRLLDKERNLVKEGDSKPYKKSASKVQESITRHLSPSSLSDLSYKKLNAAKEKIKKLEEKIERLENDNKAFETQDPKKRLTASEAAILMLTVCDKIGNLPNDKKKVSPLLESCWGFTEQTAERAFSKKPSQEVADKLAKKFDGISPSLANLIRAFPAKSEEMRIEKLKANNKKKVKK